MQCYCANVLFNEVKFFFTFSLGYLTPDTCFVIQLLSLSGEVAVSFMQNTIYSNEKLSEDLANKKELFLSRKYLCYIVFRVKYRFGYILFG